MIRIAPFEAPLAEQWDDFVKSSRNGNLFHLRSFLSYHPKDRFQDASLLFFKDDALLAVLPAAEGKYEHHRALVAHPGASYGGLVMSDECSAADTGEIVQLLEAHARKEKYAAISFLRLPPASVRRRLSDDQEYWLFQKNWKPDRMELDGSIDVSFLPEDPLLSFTGKCRNAVRQAQKSGLEAAWSDDFAAFWTILSSVLQGRHAAKPTHSIEEIKRLRSLLPDSIRLLGAFDGKKMVGGIVVVTLHSDALYTLYMGQDYSYSDRRPMHLLLSRLIELARDERRKTVHLGVSTEDGGKKVNEGLLFFKESFGMKPVVRESWVKLL